MYPVTLNDINIPTVYFVKKKRSLSLGGSSQNSTISKANKQMKKINSGAPTQTK